MTEEQNVKAKADFEALVDSREEAKRRQQMHKDMQNTIGFGRGTRDPQ